MGEKTGISWTDATWNPVRGCSRVSEGCRNCYAERVAARFSGTGQPYEGLASLKRRVMVGERDRQKHVRTHDGRKINDGLVTDARWTGVVRLIPEHLADPLRWKRPRRVFVNSMSDLFHESLTNEQIAAVFGVMAAAPQHTFQVLTKRAQRMREWFEWLARETAEYLATPSNELAEPSWVPTFLCATYARGELDSKHAISTAGITWPLPNVWLGVSVENQEAADERIPELLRTPAAVWFLSCEPLLGSVNVLRHLKRDILGSASVDWVIAGCESGPGARECKVEWLRSLRDQCEAAGVPYFLKQARYTPNEWVHGLSATLVVGADTGSKTKSGGVIELPYLDGVQHAAFPETAR